MADEIQRVLFVSPKVHIYAVPPLTSRGYRAADWNVDSEKSCIFTARIRIIETATRGENDDDEKVHTDVRLEDPRTGDLFANCPYENVHSIEQVIDSSRFFAVRVVDGSRKATLGIGFEDRSEAFDFGVCLQEVRRHNNMDGNNGSGGAKGRGGAAAKENAAPEKKDYSLKEGEMINITIGNKGRRRAPSGDSSKYGSNGAQQPIPFLPPPPTAEDIKRSNRNSKHLEETKLGFDDDAFGDFV